MELSCDAYLGGKVQIWQPAKGYRAGVDPVLLAAACPAKGGQSVLELGSGVGTALRCLGARVNDLDLWALERQPEMAALAERNGLRVVQGDLTEMPVALKSESFDHVIANPPYFLRDQGVCAPDTSREEAMGEQTPLSAWLIAARKRLKPLGWFTLIHRAERLGDVLAGLDGFGAVQVLPLQPRIGRPARLILVRARKGGRAPLQLLAPMLMHEGAEHGQDASDYTVELCGILRDGAPVTRFDAPSI